MPGLFSVEEYAFNDGLVERSSRLELPWYSQEKLLKDKIVIKGFPIKATYNGPFTLPLLRRNEAMFKIEWKS